MKVSNPTLKQLDSKTLGIHHHTTASYARKVAQNDSYTHGVLKSLVVSFQGERVAVVVCAAPSNCGAPVLLTSSFTDAQSAIRFKRALQERNLETEAQQTLPLDDSQQTHQVLGLELWRAHPCACFKTCACLSFICSPRAQVSSSSEDAADDVDEDFEPEPGKKRKLSRKQGPRISQPALNKQGGGGAGSGISIPFTKCVVNPKDMGADMKQFLENAGVTWSAYVHQTEMQYSMRGTMHLNESGMSLTKSLKNQSVPNEFCYDDISCIKTTMGGDETRHLVFQTLQGLIFALDIKCASGDYSKFRT